MKKLLSLLMLLLCVCSGAWADDAISCSAYLSGTNGSPTVTDCTLAFYSDEGSAGTVAAGTQVGTTSYYAAKMNNDKNYYVVTLNKTVGVNTYTKFKAGDVITVYLQAQSNSQQYKVGKTTATLVSASNSTDESKVYGVDHTLTAAEIESDGTVRIYRNSSKTYFAGISVSGTRTPKTAVTLSFVTSSGSADISGSAVLPAVSSDPDETDITDNISYSSSNSAVATVNSSTGAVTMVGIGTTIITASFAGDATYDEATATYTLTVTDATKLGYAEVLNPDNKTVGARWTFGFDHASVSSPLFGSQVSNYPARSVTVYLNGTAAANQYTNTSTWYKTVNEAAYQDNQWVGYDITVDDGYVLNLTNLAARLLLSDDVTLKWKVVITDKNDVQLYTSTDQETKRSTTANLSQAISLSSLTGTVHVRVYMHSTGTTKGFSIEKLILTGSTAADSRPEHTITFAAGTGSGTVPADITIRDGETFFFPAAPLLYKTGSTLTAWNDGTSNHNVGTSVTVSADMDLTAQFTDNTVAFGDAATTVEWSFKTGDGAPAIKIEGGGSTPVVYSSRATIGTTPFDALMTIDATSGKFDNTSNATYAQVATGTKFTIPAVDEMVVTLHCNQPTTAMTDASFDGNDADAFDGTARTLTYTYSGPKTEIDIIVNNGSLYPDGISVAYPYVKTKYDAPTITVAPVFNFEHKGYEVTITAAEGDLYVSTDGVDYTKQTPPYTTYATATTHFYAKATGASYGDSDVAEENVANTFDNTKPYVAWVYKKDYGSASYAFNTDPMITALQSIYNVVEVNYADSDTPSTDLNNADLIVCSEAMTGNKTSSNGMKAFAGVTPMIGLKAFNYTKGRWSWGTPANPGSTTTVFTPNSALYKVLDGVAFEGDGTIKLATATSGNVIQTVEFGTTDCTAPDGNTILGTIGGNDNKAVMYTSTKFFGLGLSSDCWQYYTANAITIVKNAAAMLIAGEALDAEVASVAATTAASGFTTYASSYALDFANAEDASCNKTLKAYVVSEVSKTAVTLTEVTSAPAETGVILMGTASTAYTIPVTDAPAAVGTNKLTAVVNATTVEANTVYVVSGGKFCLYTGTAIPAGKAYLAKSLVPNEARELSFAFGDETTGIADVRSKMEDVRGDFYNLNGQRISQPTKGLYIVNGRKVIVK